MSLKGVKCNFVASCVSHVTLQILTVYGGPLKIEDLDLKISFFER